MDKKEKNKNNIGLPNKVAWIAAEILFRIYFFFKGVRFDNTNVKQITKQCVFISPHFMDFDPMLLSCLLFPRRTTFIVSYHLYHIKGLDKLIPLAHCICKKQFANDPGATRKILRAYKEGNNIGIFPEGREGPYGKNVNVADGTATLFRKMGLDIFRVYIEGAYKSKPKWALYKRKWHIRVSMEKVADGEAVKAMSEAEVQSLIEKAIAHDGEKDCPNHQYKSKNLIAGLDSILHLCPVCKKESLYVEDQALKCDCGLNVTMDGYYKLHGGPFESINDWYDWQFSELDIDNLHLESNVTVGAIDKDGFVNKQAGRGVIRMNKEVFTYDGTLFGEEVHLEDKCKDIKAFPMKPNKYIKTFHNGDLMYYYMDDGKYAVKWVYAMDKIRESLK